MKRSLNVKHVSNGFHPDRYAKVIKIGSIWIFAISFVAHVDVHSLQKPISRSMRESIRAKSRSSVTSRVVIKVLRLIQPNMHIIKSIEDKKRFGVKSMDATNNLVEEAALKSTDKMLSLIHI